ncbi:MAG: class E sortase [Thermoleophilaceae bacterium]
MARQRSTHVRAVVRFLAAVVAVAGALLIADAVITVAWQEPISAMIASREQDRLQGQLAGLKNQSAADARSLNERDLRRRIAVLASRARARAKTGRAIGTIRLPTLHRHYVMVQGTDTASLRKGPGHYPATPFPGEHGTTAVAGHRTTYLAPFRTVDKLKKGDRIVADMPYGQILYAVEATKVVKPTALWVTRRVDHDRIVLSACHPLYSASHRIVVFARLVSVAPPV